MSAFGTKRTCISAPQMSAFGGKADIVVLCHHTDSPLGGASATNGFGPSRINISSAIHAMSAIGTKRTYRVALHMSAFGGKADIDPAPQNVR
jgi:hypothetical protein